MASERPRPTEAELSILRVLWEHGPLSVRAVLKKLNEEKPIGYTNVLKVMQIMTDKGLVERDESCRPQIYRPRDPQARTQRQLLRHMLDRVFGGSTRAMVLQALSEKKTSAQDLKAIEKLLDKIDGDTFGAKPPNVGSKVGAKPPNGWSTFGAKPPNVGSTFGAKPTNVWRRK